MNKKITRKKLEAMSGEDLARYFVEQNDATTAGYPGDAWVTIDNAELARKVGMERFPIEPNNPVYWGKLVQEASVKFYYTD